MPADASTASVSASPPESDAPGRRVEVDAEGYRLDAETGEVVGHVDLPEGRLRITAPDGVDWVLEKVQAAQRRLRDIETLRAAQLANLEQMEAGPRNNLRWLLRRFGGEVAAQAERDMAAEGNRGKTAKYPHGQVARRRTPGSAAILEPKAALAFVEEHAPECVKKTVGIEGVRAAIEAERRLVGDDAELLTDTTSFFKSAEPAEKWVIDTGIGKETIQ